MKAKVPNSRMDSRPTRKGDALFARLAPIDQRSSCSNVQDAKKPQNGADQFKHTAGDHHGVGPWNIRRNHAHLEIRRCEMSDAADQKPEENEAEA